ncbi:hypothetical protein M3J09_009203 [Ascochyta lentis]
MKRDFASSCRNRQPNKGTWPVGSVGGEAKSPKKGASAMVTLIFGGAIAALVIFGLRDISQTAMIIPEQPSN